MRQRVAVLCPGRGGYGAAQLGSLAEVDTHPRAGRLAALLDDVDQRRRRDGDLAIHDMDGADRFLSRFLLGENAAPLIFAVSAFDHLRLDPEKVEVVAVGGNSMGWYTALACAGALELEQGMRLVETMGAMTRDGTIGGQVIYPVVDSEWRPSAMRQGQVARALSRGRSRGECGHSIHFGGFEVLWGDTAALQAVNENLPAILFGKQEYPLQLFGNSAFHSALMTEVSVRGHERLGDLPWAPPSIPLVDGRGVQWRPLSTDVDRLASYTLGHQVVETFDFGATVRTILREYAPDRLVLLGPGQSLGGAVAHCLIRERWRGITSRERFVDVQLADPFLVSTARPDQAALVV